MFNLLGNRNIHERTVHLKLKTGMFTGSRRDRGVSDVGETVEQRRDRWMKSLEEAENVQQ